MRLVSADHVNGNSQGLRQLGDILWRNHAGVVRAIREHNHNFSSGGLSVVKESEQKSVVEGSIVPGHGRAHGAQYLRAVRSERRRPEEVTTVRIESYLVRAFEGTNEIRDSILRKDEPTIHVVAGIEQNEHIGAGDQRVERPGRVVRVSLLRRATRRDWRKR